MPQIQIRLFPTTFLERFFLTMFLVSTPVCVVAVFMYSYDRNLAAVLNSYAFSIGMVGLYVAPLVFGTSSREGEGWGARIHAATMNWVVYLTVLTEVVFQVPHNLFTKELLRLEGTVFEWPFASYGLSDGRWNTYITASDGSVNLKPEVWLINVNDGYLGIAVGVALAWVWFTHRRTAKRVPSSNRKSERAFCFFVLITLFRDATLFRETVEYMWIHHRDGYPDSTSDPTLRPHAIACLWLVNIIWLVAPCVTLVWAHTCLTARNEAHAKLQ